ncbi:phage major tail tube protein [Comamonas piscis]|uniref:Phage major tail tube protein n=1 Tax=Comamonas piscis TaxID=1562974 RepID=A0A7G5ELZ1_9BURK|nr:phage major tail tube protein [Comamonas piscis]QMV75016.1 phage major tail tube protein [Comamonas piscis]WSO33496.1 phage major tail tube protein [Comamonas piscis]
MGLPRKLKNFAVFKDGVSYLGEVPAVTLPVLTRKMDDYQAGGMGGPVKQDFGMEALSMEYKMGGWADGSHSGFGSGIHDGTMLRFAGALDSEGTGQVDVVEVVARGRISEIDKGEAKVGEATEHTYKMELSYYKEVLNGQTLVEIDFVNMIENIDGVDNMAAVRAALTA